MRIESITHQGLQRKNNEDRYMVNLLDHDCALLVIADGMGGHAAGEVAAELALESFEGYRPGGPDIRAELLNQIEEAQKRIMERSEALPSLSGMGTTLTALFLTGRSAFWAHVGDTRIYHFRKGSLIRITEDHTMAGMLLKKGEITREQARFHPYGSVLTRCLGCGEQHDPDSGAFGLTDGDYVLLSSDGLHDLISDEQIAAFLSQDITLKEKLDRMISACLHAGGRDNITAVIARI
jgi:protein phosphatase